MTPEARRMTVEADDLHLGRLAAKYLKQHARLIAPPLEKPVTPLVCALEYVYGRRLARQAGFDYHDPTVQEALPTFAQEILATTLIGEDGRH